MRRTLPGAVGSPALPRESAPQHRPGAAGRPAPSRCEPFVRLAGGRNRSRADARGLFGAGGRLAPAVGALRGHECPAGGGCRSRVPDARPALRAVVGCLSRRVVGPSLRLRSGGFGGAERRMGAPVNSPAAEALNRNRVV
jgi:hypothetical protein